MKKLFTILVLVTCFQSGIFAQAKLIESVRNPGNPEDPTINYSKYVLPNGLTVILAEDHSDPLVHVDVTYHVGSAREDLTHSGFAHFFEHMMFQGSKHVGDEEHFRIVTEAGGTMNGSTNRDRTNYFETVPKNYLERALWLEADRMGFLLDSVTQKKFEVQRATVKNEKGQRYENRPYGMASEIVARNFYPFGHPYSWPTIGYVDDLNRVNVEDLKKFFLRWYGPNNAVLSIGGDFNTAEVIKLVEKYYGPIPKGPDVRREFYHPFMLPETRHISYEDNVRFPQLRVVFPSVCTYHSDEAAIDILCAILSDSKSSPLYQAFVKGQKAVSVSAYNNTDELAGELTFVVNALPGTSLAETEKLLFQTIKDYIAKGVSKEDVDRVIAQRVASTMYGLETVSGKVSQLAAFQTYLMNPNMMIFNVERYKGVRPTDILRVYKQYFENQNYLELSIVPKGKSSLVAAKDDFKCGGDTSKYKMPNYDTLKMRPVADVFDRSKMPAAGPSPIVVPPVYESSPVAAGIPMLYTRNTEVHDASFQIYVACGRQVQPKGKEGISNMLARMLSESNMIHTGEQLEDLMSKMGSSVSFSTNNENIVCSGKCLAKNFEITIQLLNEMFIMPKFDSTEFERVKKQILEGIANQKTQADALASQAFSAIIYGPEHPYGTPSAGTIESVKAITLQDVINFYHTYFLPSLARVVVSGDVSKDQVMFGFDIMGGWQGGTGAPAPRKIPAPAATSRKIYLVDKPGAPQSEIRVGNLSLPFDALGDNYKTKVMNYALGGSFNCRLNLNLREKHGYTYGIRGSFSGDHQPGTFLVSAGVRGDATDSAVKEIMYEINNYRDKGITKTELAFTKHSLLDKEALSYESNSQRAGYLSTIQDYNLPSDFTTQQAKILKKMKKKTINSLAKKYLPVDQMIIVVAGDAKVLKPKLAALGLGEVIDYKVGDDEVKH